MLEQLRQNNGPSVGKELVLRGRKIDPEACRVSHCERLCPTTDRRGYPNLYDSRRNGDITLDCASKRTISRCLHVSVNHCVDVDCMAYSKEIRVVVDGLERGPQICCVRRAGSERPSPCSTQEHPNWDDGFVASMGAALSILFSLTTSWQPTQTTRKPAQMVLLHSPFLPRRVWHRRVSPLTALLTLSRRYALGTIHPDRQFERGPSAILPILG